MRSASASGWPWWERSLWFYGGSAMSDESTQWLPGSRHLVRGAKGLGDGWQCVDCGQRFDVWPDDSESCAGVAQTPDTRPPDDDDATTCDWGHCNEEGVTWRWADDLKQWLPVCAEHKIKAEAMDRALATEEFQPTTARLIDGQVVIGTKPYTRWQRIKRRYWRLQTTDRPVRSEP